jgi:hypothetical protein
MPSTSGQLRRRRTPRRLCLPCPSDVQGAGCEVRVLDAQPRASEIRSPESARSACDAPHGGVPAGTQYHSPSLGQIATQVGLHLHLCDAIFLAAHRRFHLHYTPTGSSWLNLVDRWFRELSQKRIRRGSFATVRDLKRAIHEYLAENNTHPKPFVWTASVDKIGQGQPL